MAIKQEMAPERPGWLSISNMPHLKLVSMATNYHHGVCLSDWSMVIFSGPNMGVRGSAQDVSRISKMRY